MIEFLLIISTTSLSIFLFIILPNNTSNNLYMSSIITISLLSLTTLLYLKTNNNNIEINLILTNSTNTNILLNTAIDYLSSLLLLLSTTLLISCLLISNTTIYHTNKNLILCLLITTLILNIAFTTTHMLLFYILFESSIIPLIIIISLWGARNENIRASYYFLLYTIIGSLPLLLTILTINNKNSTFLTFLIQNTTDTTSQTIQFIGLFLAFAINTPLLPWHTWLPLAHVEAPAIGSILLAGILLNLGAYGFIRFTLPTLPITSNFLSPLIISISICSLWLASLNSLRQNDINRIIAYSSIAHMGIITAAIFSQNNISNNGAILLMISHGLTSPILFILTSLLYERHNTRLLNSFNGTSQLTPLLTTLFLITSLAHMSTPGSLNFIGEFICLLGLWELHPLTALLSIPGILITTAYLLLLFIHISSSNTHINSLYNLHDTNNNELYAIFSLITPNILLGISPLPLSPNNYNLIQSQDLPPTYNLIIYYLYNIFIV